MRSRDFFQLVFKPLSSMSTENYRFSFNSISQRNYFAAAAAETKKPIAARLKEQSLETREPHIYYSKLLLNENKSLISVIQDSSHDTLLESLQCKLKLKSWAKKFSISSSGIIVYNQQSPISSVYVNALKERQESPDARHYIEYREKFSQLMALKKECIPDLLYSIPQDIWDSFIAKLPYQDAVNLLNLSIHRHLWPAYNYAASADTDQIKRNRATQFGEYHFLISLLNSEEFVEWCPSILRDSEVKSLFFQIDHGEKVIDFFKAHGPYFTPLFINKFAHCPSLSDLILIGNKLVMPKVASVNSNFNKQKLSEFIGTLPSSKKEPLLFSRMIKDARDMESQLAPLPEKVNSNIFYGIRNHFGFFKEKNYDAKLLKDYFEAITLDLIFPEFVRQLVFVMGDSFNIKEFLNLALGLCERLPAENYLSRRLSEQLAIFFTERLALQKLVALEKRWHRNITVISGKKPLELSESQWHSLFKEQVIDQISFICLTSSTQLKKEGNEMNHCIGGYTAECMDGSYHIVKIVSHQTGERSTLQLKVVKQDDGAELVSIIQNSAQCVSTKMLTDTAIYIV
jgi:PcfJ-like protein